MQPSYVEIAWVRDNHHLTFVDARIAELVGWSIEEINAMANAHDVLVHPDYAHTTRALMSGTPNTIAAHTLDLALRHKNGHDVPVQSTIICRYDESGNIAEMWGSTHPTDGQYTRMDAWWKQSCSAAQALSLDMTALYPAAT